MKRINEVMTDILKISTEIETEYPELYKYLEETPFHICKTDKNEICKDDLEEYLQTLKDQLQHHVETHKKK